MKLNREGDAVTTRVLFVCLGNICRSPLAENIFREHVRQAGREGEFEIDSAGTGAYHEGESPDRRMTATARKHGLELKGHARQFRQSDYDEFDWIIAMDASNRANMLQLARDNNDRAKVQMLREFDPTSINPNRIEDVPDPYYGGGSGFEDVYKIVERSSQELLATITR